jgi:hypothetical protein
MQMSLQNFSDVDKFSRSPTIGGKYKKVTKPKVKEDKK